MTLPITDQDFCFHQVISTFSEGTFSWFPRSDEVCIPLKHSTHIISEYI